MEAPQTNHEVGWYEKSARVGQTSSQSVLLDGHYGAAWDKGVFYDLHKIKEGAKIILAGREGGKATYEVKEIERRKLEEVDMKKAFYKYPDSVQSLTLITCEGQYDASRATYDDRIVVYAARVN